MASTRRYRSDKKLKAYFNHVFDEDCVHEAYVIRGTTKVLTIAGALEKHQRILSEAQAGLGASGGEEAGEGEQSSRPTVAASFLRLQFPDVNSHNTLGRDPRVVATDEENAGILGWVHAARRIILSPDLVEVSVRLDHCALLEYTSLAMKVMLVVGFPLMLQKIFQRPADVPQVQIVLRGGARRHALRRRGHC